ncbi:hypothetical protein DSO57_1033895 [Entomophthora muscae]|uniref:Uncharacterized protein n=1 Tax=Entomophthora muscae TaxID=34485 RepID=A0ACC2SCX8_9FUNG|nr:hypothetical protein DSO57_1033895 [Entomophthora muscae]
MKTWNLAGARRTCQHPASCKPSASYLSTQAGASGPVASPLPARQPPTTQPGTQPGTCKPACCILRRGTDTQRRILTLGLDLY